ncbi:Fungalysin metallopeptidase-domain-containing protein [Flagelloscypha sp. PMI_526]|nr:Fungalysin metallopeptidase-domain-containing protein [Flagelloscypha sp. PMI_526]
MLFLTAVKLALFLASFVTAHEHYSTRETHIVGRGLEFESFHPASTFEGFGAGVDHPTRKRASSSLESAAKEYVASKLGINEDTITFSSGTDGTDGSVAKVAYVKQTHDGVTISNAVANVAFGTNDKVTSFGSSFVKIDKIADSTPTITEQQAISAAEKKLEGTWNNTPTRVEYLARADKTVALTHVVQIQNDSTSLWVEAFVDAHTGEVIQINNFVADIVYRVIEIPNQSPNQGFTDVTDPADELASPWGWQSVDGTTQTTVTSGNNAIAYIVSQNATTSESAPGEFIYLHDPTLAANAAINQDVARVNAFYLVNSIHDITYRYGFTESTFNFQKTNIADGGKANDHVLVSVQDSSGKNNANFATPPDGQSGQMRMYIFDITSPTRDGSLQNDIVIHEMTHGITNRMTGGGTAACLQSTEARGMGEGWSDAMSNWNAMNSTATPDLVTGTYVLNNTAGVRTKPYSTSMTVNPYTYSRLKTQTEVHNIGEVWANILYNVYAALVEQYGWSETGRTNPDGTEGNVVWLHLFLDALLLQPCNPTFVSARAAWIQADADRYAGVNKCLLWKVFASRGLGVNATASTHNDDLTVPDDCA